jgi:hypothetical protein
MSTSVPPPLLDRLAQTHASVMNRLALQVWDDFVVTVVATLRVAEARLRDPSYMAKYSARTGWWRKKAQKNRAKRLVRLPAEDSITDALTDLLDQIRNEATENDPIYAKNIVFNGQQPRKTQTRIGANSLTTDIRAFVPGTRELDLRIEAKILFKSDDLALEYCSERGIRRFGDPENPYTDQIIGAMLGYSLTRSLASWYEDIEKHLGDLSHVSDTGLATISGETNPTLICDVIRRDGSSHRVTILHLLMEFDTEPSSRCPSV